ncbi:MAG TPA: hypothetical protein VKI20_11165 [Acidimicrobiales bacterium]|nr:hypothetical protein [Acidimicrobiales bacterium]
MVVALALTSCRSSSPAAGGPRADHARIGLIEWEITASAGKLVAGPVTLQVTNAGTTAHDLRVQGRRAVAQTVILAPGQSATLAVDLTGERQVQLWCTVAGHRAQGMHRRIPVS